MTRVRPVAGLPEWWRKDVGDLDLGEYLERYRGKHLVLIIAPLGDAASPNYTFGICRIVT